MSKKHTDSQWDCDGNFDLEATIDERFFNGKEPTSYNAPGRDQKWRARELFGFMWRHLGIKIPPGYRDVMLLLIEKANATTGQLNWRQSKMAELTLLSRQYINEACRRWAEETPFLGVDRRKNMDGRFVSNAYHLRWKAIDKAWVEVMAHVAPYTTRHANETRRQRDANVTTHVVCNPTTHVATYPTTVVASDPTTRNSKEKCKEETHHEMAPASRAAFNEEKNGFQEEQGLKASNQNSLSAEPLSQKAARVGISNEEWRKVRGAR